MKISAPPQLKDPQLSAFLRAVFNGMTSLPTPVTTVPTTSASSGTTGEFAYDTNFIYICVATDTWRRVAIAAF